MASTEELIAIVGGAIAGLIVLLIIMATIIYCVCGKGREKREEKKNRYRDLGPSVADQGPPKPAYMNGLDPRMLEARRQEQMLPKVGSSGLWMGAPSMYTRDPSEAYYSDKKRTSSLQRPLQRAPSETRLPQSNGHMVYQNNNLALYHSQQVPGVYGHPYLMHNNYHNMYPYNYGNPIRDSRAILVEYPDEQQYFADYRGRYVDEHDSQRRGNKVKRTHSDLTGTKRKKQRNRRPASPSASGSRNHQHYDSDSNKKTTSVEVYERRVGHQHKPVDEQTKTFDFKDQDFPPESATDSAKLRALHHDKTRDQQDISNKWKETKDDLRLNLPKDDDDNGHIKSHYYEYSGHLSSNHKTGTDGVVKALVSPQGHENLAFSADEIRTSTARKDVETPRTDYMDSHRKIERAESNADGKEISSAFDFLNHYTSDDEGTEHFGSRADSPVQL